MILRQELRGAKEQAVWDLSRDECERVLKRFGIKNPRCGMSIGIGWIPTVERAFEKMIEAGWDKQLDQVKQKFCGLRIYIGQGSFDDVDNPVKRFFRVPIQWVALRTWPNFKNATLKKAFHLVHMSIWNLIRSPLLRETKPSKIALIIDDAELECDKLCEFCGQKRRHEGFDWGLALCDACGEESQHK